MARLGTQEWRNNIRSGVLRALSEGKGAGSGWPKGVQQTLEHRRKNSIGVKEAIKRGADIGGSKKTRGRPKSPEEIEAVRKALRSKVWNTSAWKLKMSANAKAHLEQNILCTCAAHRIVRGETVQSRLEERMAKKFLSEFPEVHLRQKFGRYEVDAYLPPPYHLAFEADGSYWHRHRANYDARRDAYLLKQFQLPVIRLTEAEINAV